MTKADVVVAHAVPRAVIDAGRIRTRRARPEHVTSASSVGARAVTRAAVDARSLCTGSTSEARCTFTQTGRSAHASMFTRRGAGRRRAVVPRPSGVADASENSMPHAERAMTRAVRGLELLRCGHSHHFSFSYPQHRRVVAAFLDQRAGAGRYVPAGRSHLKTTHTFTHTPGPNTGRRGGDRTQTGKRTAGRSVLPVPRCR